MFATCIVRVISIHALRKESDSSTRNTHPRNKRFQSTLSVRRATGYVQEVAEHLDISIHALRKESDLQPREGRCGVLISIHALRKESDQCQPPPHHNRIISIHALRKESDQCQPPPHHNRIISIHALRKESDLILQSPFMSLHNFNPRSP